MSHPLTNNAIKLINSDNLNVRSLLQVFSIATFGQGTSSTVRYKLELSDGIHLQKATLPSKFNDLITTGQIQKGSIVQLNEFSIPTICDARWIVVSKLEVYCTDQDIIGDPTFFFKEPENLLQQHLGASSDTCTNVGDLVTSQQANPTKLMFGLHASLRKKTPPTAITPFRSLNPFQTQWMIQGRVTMKKDIHHFTNKNRDGHMFSFDMIDSERTEVRVTCFNAIADFYFQQVEAGSVYTLTRGTVKSANKFYNKLNSDIEITLTDDSRLIRCDDDLLIPTLQFTFIPIKDILAHNANSSIDLIGIVICVDPSSTIKRKSDSTEVLRRSLKMVDMSTATINVTLWGKAAQKEGTQLQEMYHLQEVTVLAIKKGRVAEYNGKVVSTLATSQLFINPDIEETKQLRSWFAQNGNDFPMSATDLLDAPTVLTRKTISTIIEKPSDFTKPLQCIVRVTLVFIKTKTICYPACPMEIGGKQCKKRVEQHSEGNWFCSKCVATFADCNYRYVLQVKLEDPTGAIWATAFDEAATKLVGMSAKDLYTLQFSQEAETCAEEVIKHLQCRQFLFTLSNTMETYNNEKRLKTTIVEIDTFDFTDESNFLLHEIPTLCIPTTK